MKDDKEYSESDFLKEKKWLIIKLLIVILPGIFYWVTSDDNYEKKISFDVSMNAGVSSNKTNSDENLKNQKVINPPAQNYLNETQLFNEALAAFARNDYNTAINFYSQVIEINPVNVNAYINRGNCYRNLKNYNQAISEYSNAIKLQPKNSAAYTNRAMIHNELKNYNQAISDCTIAIQCNSQNIDAYVTRSISYIRLNDINQAFNDSNMAIQNSVNIGMPINLALAYYVRGTCYQIMGDSQKAQADMIMARQLGYNPVQK